MQIPTYEEAARLLVAARQEMRPGPRLPEFCRPRDIESALAIQRRVGELLGFAIGGWKCSLPSAERRIVVAPIYAPTIASTSPCAVLGDGKVARIEPEIAFVLGRDLPQRRTPYSDVEVRDAIGETRLVLELIGGRYADPASVGFLEQLADGVNNQGLYRGPIVAGAFDRALESFPIAVDGPSGSLLMREGKHPDGHPLLPLYWLANYRAGQGDGLKAGQIVTTGSYVGVIEVPLGMPLKLSYGDLGVLNVQFSALQPNRA